MNDHNTLIYYLYALVCPSMPGVVKIGQTENGGRIRRDQIRNGSGLTYHLVYETCVSDGLSAEKELLSVFSDCILPGSTEYICQPAEKVIEEMSRVAGNWLPDGIAVAKKRPNSGSLSFQRKLYKAIKAAACGEIEPSIIQIRKLCNCGDTTAIDIREELKSLGFDLRPKTKPRDKPCNKVQPIGKRIVSYQRNLAKAESAVKSGDIQPSVRQIRALCSCGQSTATSIRAELIRRGLAESDSSGRVSTA